MQEKNIIGLKVKIIKKEKKKTEEKRKKGKKGKPQNGKSPMQRQSFITTIESVTEYKLIYLYSSVQFR